MLTQFKNLRFVVAFIILGFFAITSTRAQTNQPPSGKFGLGIYASNAFPSGLVALYALSPNLEVGSMVSLSNTSGGGFTGTTFLLGPFVRVLFPTSVSPFVQGGFQIISRPAPTGTTVGLFLGGGVAYYINHEIGLHAGFDLLDISFSNPSTTTVGWGVIRGEGDWFF